MYSYKKEFLLTSTVVIRYIFDFTLLVPKMYITSYMLPM